MYEYELRAPCPQIIGNTVRANKIRMCAMLVLFGLVRTPRTLLWQ